MLRERSPRTAPRKHATVSNLRNRALLKSANRKQDTGSIFKSGSNAPAHIGEICKTNTDSNPKPSHGPKD